MNNTLFSRLAGTLLALVLMVSAQAQPSFTVSGRITDAATGEGIPFASLAIKGTSTGTTSDADGNYRLTGRQTGDSLLVSSLGYQTQALALRAVAVQTVNVRLSASALRLQEVKVYTKGGDPAYRILQKAISRRDEFNPRRLKAYQYESYSKVEAYVNNFSEARKKGRRPGPVKRLLGRLPAMTDEDGKPAVPVYVSETVSEYYYRSDPEKTRERILKSHASGVGISDGGVAAQLTGASFQQFNFYDNYISLFRKDLPSPLGQFWQAMYRFQLIDTVAVAGVPCFQIDFEPRQERDLAFSGTVWLDTTRLGLTQIETRIDKKANINLVDEIRLTQEWQEVEDSTLTRPVRLPVLTQLLIDTQQPTPQAPGAILRFYLAAQQPRVTRPEPLSFYEPALELADNYREKSPQFWQQARPASLASSELRAFEVVDSVRNVPFMKALGNVVQLTTVGYFPLKNWHLDLGPLLNSYAYNNVEGHRLRLGLRTNTGFSRRWTLSGYLAYGTRDQAFKRGAAVEYIVGKKPWTVVGLQYSQDLERLGASSETLGGNSLFAAYTRFGQFRRPYWQQLTQAYWRRELGSGFTQTVSLSNRTFEPWFPFAYRQSVGEENALRNHYRTTELTLETRFAPGELMIQNDNERYSVTGSNRPVLLFRYNLGVPLLGGDFSYHRFQLSLKQSFRLGVLGRTSYQLNTGYIPSTLPYPLLYVPLGNETVFQVSNAYNLMNFFEFVVDRYAGLMVEHNFEGLFFNRLPAVRRMKWRFLATGKVLVGGVSASNRALIPDTDEQGHPVAGFASLGSTPYLEVGYGIDNILKVFRVDAIHRLTYRSNPGVSTFGLRVSAWVNL